jgi:hypothetical protein
LKIKNNILLFVLVAVFSASSFATVNCSGTIARVYVANGGDVVVWPSWSEEYHKICNLNSEWKSISTETCKAWSSIAIAAKVSQTLARAQYSAENSCSGIATYAAAPAPSYFMLDK